MGVSFCLPKAQAVDFQPMYLQIQEITGAAGMADLVKRIYNYALGIIAVFALGAIVYGSVLWIISAGSPGKLEDAKSWILGAIVGIVLMFGAVLLFREINPNLPELVEPELPPVTTPTPDYSLPPMPEYTALYGTSTPSAMALRLLDQLKSAGIHLSRNADCAPGSDARSVLSDLANGRAVLVCSKGCTKTSGCERRNLDVDANLLYDTGNISAGVSRLTVTSVTGGNHSENSLHYQGKAVDVVPTSNKAADWDRVVEAYNSSGLYATCDLNGTFYSKCGSIVGKPGAHIHVQSVPFRNY